MKCDVFPHLTIKINQIEIDENWLNSTKKKFNKWETTNWMKNDEFELKDRKMGSLWHLVGLIQYL